jgi:predicted nucleic-acid-binding protein
LIGEDAQQTKKARALIGVHPVFLPKTVLMETAWVLRRSYDVPMERIVSAFRALAGLPGVSFEDAGVVARPMEWAEAGMEFADALHLASAGKCEVFLTFDKRLARAGARLADIAVETP